MPGRVVMEQQHTFESQELKKGRGHVQVGEMAQQLEGAQESGKNGLVPNGVSSIVNGALAQNTSTSSTMNPTHGLPTPPELDGSWRELDGNKPMGVLVERLAQQCMGDLNEALIKMADVPQLATHANGVVAHAVDTSEASISKKKILMDFAHNQRDRFIKTLVLSDWARNAEDMAKLVDIRVWQEKQERAQNQAKLFIGSMKSNMAGAKMPNPNIEGALELLATGKTSRVPDLGYLPAKRLTAKQLLRTLQDMNVTLATRLNLYDELPCHFDDFSIANGRATFRVPQEFEVDLSVADEDPSSSFYFIDIRFLFSPTPSLSDEGLRGAFEGRANAALASDRLKGCYDLLHNFVLTHKINILRDQVFTLLREKWFDCLSVDMKKRVFIIHYWSGMPGPKSWLEIGVSTGKQNSTRLQPATPQIAIRWFRKGKEVVNADDAIRVDWQDISAEAVLAATTAKHISWTLNTTKDRLQTLAGATSKLVITLTTSASTPEDCSLSLSLPGLRTPLVVQLSSVTGKWSISPDHPFTARIERTLNADPNADPALGLMGLLCQLVQERVSRAADLAGWDQVSKQALVTLPQPAVTALFGAGVVSRSIYRCSTSWGESWALIVTFGLAGEKWWATRLEPGQDTPLQAIAEVRQVPARVFDSGSVSRAQLLRVEKVAAAEVAMTVLTQELREKNIRFQRETTVPLAKQPTAADAYETHSTAVVFDAAPLVKSKADAPLRSLKADVIRLSHTGLSMSESAEGGLAEMRHTLRLTVKPGSLKHLQNYLTTTQTRNAEIAMNDSGALALELRTPFGERYMQHIRSRLEACGRFNEYIALLSLYRLDVIHLNLRRFSFVYSNSPERLTATLKFMGGDGKGPLKLNFEPKDNPQIRARVQVENAINMLSEKNPSGAFHNMVRILAVTLPAYRIFDKVEVLEPVGGTAIHVHNPLAFVVEYKAPLPICKVTLHLRQKEGGFNWNVGSPLITGDGRGLPDPMRFALLQLCQEKGEGWFGDGRMRFVVEPSGISEVLMKLDEVIRKFGGGGRERDDAKGEAAALFGGGDGATTAAKHSPLKEDKRPQQPPGTPSSSLKPKQHPLNQRNGQQQQRPAPPQRKSSAVKQEIIELD